MRESSTPTICRCPKIPPCPDNTDKFYFLMVGMCLDYLLKLVKWLFPNIRQCSIFKRKSRGADQNMQRCSGKAHSLSSFMTLAAANELFHKLELAIERSDHGLMSSSLQDNSVPSASNTAQTDMSAANCSFLFKTV